jgi:hypothetical protein
MPRTFTMPCGSTRAGFSLADRDYDFRLISGLPKQRDPKPIALTNTRVAAAGIERRCR